MRGAVWLALVASHVAAAASPPSEPSPFRLNQLGFSTGSPARAVLVSPSARASTWSVTAASGAPIARGTTRVTGHDPASDEHLHRLDLGTLPAGDGYVVSAGGLHSRPFAVSEHPFEQLARNSANFFYQQRSGIAIERAYVQRPDLARAAGHLPDIGHCFTGADREGIVWPGCTFTIDATGGWYDAGDQGKYVVNGGIAAWTLLDAVERDRAAGRRDAFPDGSLRIPEHANGAGDLLDEARWEITFLLRMQVPAGTRLKLRQPDGGFAEADAGGLAFARIADAAWTPIPTVPAQDTQPRVIYPPSTAATLNLAAVGAQCARLWRGIDAGFAARCLAAARAAYAAAQRAPALDENVSAGGSGTYEDSDTSDEQYWAAAELFATTGEPAYLAALRASPLNTAPARTLSWSETEMAGRASLALGPPGPEREHARAAILAQADGWLAERDRSGYAIPFAGTRYPWGSNGMILNRALTLGLAYDFTRRPAYREAETDALDYVLGRNALDRSYVTGIGAPPVLQPHHRFWAHQADATMPEPPPGVLSGGPNSIRDGNMPISTVMTRPCAPMACWRDDFRVFTENEVAINWNAPLVWVASHLDDAP